MTRHPTPRLIVEAERGERSTVLRLQCGHHRSIGGNLIADTWAAGAADLAVGILYPCVDGHCGKPAPVTA